MSSSKYFLILLSVLFFIAGVLFLVESATVPVHLSARSTYDVNIRSTDADDIDINLVYGSDSSIIGVKDAYVCYGEHMYFVSGSNKFEIEEYSSFNDAESVREYISSIFDRLITDRFAPNVASEIESTNGKKYYKVEGSVTSSYGTLATTYYIDKSNYYLRRVEAITGDGLTITFTLNESYCDDMVNSIGVVNESHIAEEITETFSKDNVYTVGKYKLVDNILNKYNDWLGGEL